MLIDEKYKCPYCDEEFTPGTETSEIERHIRESNNEICESDEFHKADCDICGYETKELHFVKPEHCSSFTEPCLICTVCYQTFAYNAVAFPEAYPGMEMILKNMSICTNIILDKINENNKRSK